MSEATVRSGAAQPVPEGVRVPLGLDTPCLVVTRAGEPVGRWPVDARGRSR
jgi:hypothetical protein